MKRLLLPALILLASAPAWSQEAPNPQDARTLAWLDFLGRHGDRWQAAWCKATGTPEAIYGPGLALKQGPIASLAEASALAEQVLEDHAELLGRGASSFAQSIGVQVGDNYIFVYDQYFKGLPVIGGRADVRLNRSGRLALFGSRAVPLPASFITSPSLTAARAAATGRGWMGAGPSGPEPRLVVWADTESAAPTPTVLAWEVEVSGMDLAGVVYIDARTGRVIGFEDRIYNAGGTDAPLSGTVKAWANTALTPTAPLVNIPLANLRISIPGVGTVYTDAQGGFSLAYSGTGPVNLTVGLAGRHIQEVRPLQGSYVTTTVPLTPGTPAAIQLLTSTAAEFDRTQTTVYWAANAVNEYVRGIITSGGAANLDRISQIKATVNNTTRMFTDCGVPRVLAVSHFYHLPRIKMTYQRQGWEVYTVPAAESYPLTEMPLFMLREVAALWAYYLRPLCPT